MREGLEVRVVVVAGRRRWNIVRDSDGFRLNSNYRLFCEGSGSG